MMLFIAIIYLVLGIYLLFKKNSSNYYEITIKRTVLLISIINFILFILNIFYPHVIFHLIFAVLMITYAIKIYKIYKETKDALEVTKHLDN
ncbi:gp402 [Bacillus phage G]|uniref:Gp402 n=1 Tax=Bacillus phage G TaxID=2884420 RepID=G3MAE3_9CAUD|nr:gp402 [Bacillus phage G]AEO93941.1 gp402 [Bacillus phage G]